MYTYDIFEWIGFFAVYCLIGWAGESLYVSIEHRKWVNRGFLNGPFLPIYGFGALIMLYAAIPVRDNILLTFLFGMAGATLLEYLTGYVMEKLFHVKYWDYTYEPFNLNGYICLGCSVTWGLCSLLLIRVIHRPVEGLLLRLDDKILMAADIAFMIYFVWDIVVSTREAFDLRKIIAEQILQNEKVLRLQKRLDVLIAVMDDDREHMQERWNEGRQEFQEKLEKSREELSSRIGELRAEYYERRNENKSEREAEMEKIKVELAEMRVRFTERTQAYRRRAEHILKRNPGTVSKRYKLDREMIRRIFKD